MEQEFFTDDTPVIDTAELQRISLIQYMAAWAGGYELVYSDSSVYFRNISKPGVRIGFDKAVKLFNNDTTSRYKAIKAVKLQRVRNEIIVLSHKVKFTEGTRKFMQFAQCTEEGMLKALITAAPKSKTVFYGLH